VRQCILPTNGTTYLGTSSHARRLNATDGVVHQTTTEIWVVGEAFPVTSALGDTTQRSGNGSKNHVDTLLAEFFTHVHCPLLGQLFVPAMRGSAHAFDM
jgi:hypothetical protein